MVQASAATPDAAATDLGSSPPSTGQRRSIALAVDLGWFMVEAFSRAKPRVIAHEDHVPALPAQLTTLEQLGPRGHLRMVVESIDRAVAELDGLLPETASTVSTKRLQTCLDALADRDTESAAAIRPAVNDLNIHLLIWLHAADSRVGEAYRLGRTLANLCREDGNASQRDLFYSFFGKRGGKEGQIQATLDHLSTLLPQHIATSLRMSLAQWSAAVKKVNGNEAQRRELCAQVDPAATVVPDAETLAQALGAQLRNQGEKWREMLTGRLSCEELIDEDDYIDAAGTVLRRDREIAFSTARHLLLPLLLPLLIVIGLLGLDAGLTTTGSPSVRLVAFFTAVIGATAAAWHAVAGLTKQATSRVNDPVYDRALSKQVARRVNAPLHRALSKALQRALRQSGGATGAAGKEEGAGL